MSGPLLVIWVLTFLLSLASVGLGLAALRRRSVLGGAVSLGAAAILLSASGLCVTIAVGTRGYRQFVPGQAVATVEVTPTGPGAFNATLVFPDGGETTLSLFGRGLVIEAHVLSGRALGRLLGLDRAYELAEVVGLPPSDGAGVMRETSFSLKQAKPVDVFELRQRFPPLGLLLEARSTFGELAADGRARYEVRLGESGIRVTQLAVPIP
jgi:hypothetical protein